MLKLTEGSSLMTEGKEGLTRSETFLMAVSYLEAAAVKEDAVQAELIMRSMTPYDFMGGMSVLNQAIYDIYNAKTGEGEALIAFLRQFGNAMKLEES